MLTHDALKRDTARRVKRLQAMMKENDLDALIITGQAAPGGIGAIRYITHAHLWGGAAYAVLGADDPYPWLQVWSSYQAVWSRNETTTLPERVLSPYEDIVEATASNAKDYATGSKRIGMVNMSKLMGLGTYNGFVKALEGYEMVEVTDAFNEIRQIKSPFELEAIQQNGAILDSAMDVFKDVAGVGVRYWGRLRLGRGLYQIFRILLGADETVARWHTLHCAHAKRPAHGPDDIINFEIVYESPYGYWLEMTAVFSFGPLPADSRALLDGYLAAVEASSAVAKAGNTFRDISDANDKALRDRGYPVDGKHTPDCHSTGLDGSDGPNSFGAPDFVLQPNMVLSYHPGTVLENDRGFLVSDNFLVTPEGAVRLSPHHADRYCMELEA